MLILPGAPAHSDFRLEKLLETLRRIAPVSAVYAEYVHFVDVDAATFNIDPDCLRTAITQTIEQNTLRPAAIIAVDLFGQPADYRAINAIAAEHGLFVLADAAQSFGARYENRAVGTLAPASATSFYPAKPLGCYGDGGAVFTDDDDLAAACISIRAHGEGKNRYDIVVSAEVTETLPDVAAGNDGKLETNAVNAEPAS